jgi:pSer/pThr/pTyr-binding forkhead associated (FHA) protein
MDIEIVVVGESSKWVLNQPRIRIGLDPNCEVNLPAGKYPAVSGEHVALDVVNGAVRLARGKYSSGETYLNGLPAESGAAVRSGDVLRLGAGGPELRIRLLERAPYSMPAEYEPTRVMNEPIPPVHEPTRVMHEPTRVISNPTATNYSPAQPSTAGTAGRQVYSTQAAYGGAASAYTPVSPAVLPRRPDAGPNAGGAQAGYGQLRAQETPSPAAAARAAENGSLSALEDKLKTMRLLLVANLAILVLLCVWVFMQGRELAQTHKELQELRVQAQSAVGQLTPSLDARLSVFEKRMDAMDAQVAAAQDRMVKGMDAQAKLAEDRMVERMNTEIPAMLDKFVSKKLTELKH